MVIEALRYYVNAWVVSIRKFSGNFLGSYC